MGQQIKTYKEKKDSVKDGKKEADNTKKNEKPASTEYEDVFNFFFIRESIKIKNFKRAYHKVRHFEEII